MTRLEQQDIKIVAEQQYDWNKLTNKTILISGGTGFVGSFIIEVLRYRNIFYHQGIKVISLSRRGGKSDDIQDKYEQIQEVTSVEDDLMKDIRTVEKNAEEVNILKKMTRHIAETFVEEITIYDSEKIEIRFVFDDLLIGMADRIKKKTEDIA